MDGQRIHKSGAKTKLVGAPCRDKRVHPPNKGQMDASLAHRTFICWHQGFTESSFNDSECFLSNRKDVIDPQLCVTMGVRLVVSVPPLRQSLGAWLSCFKMCLVDKGSQ